MASRILLAAGGALTRHAATPRALSARRTLAQTAALGLKESNSHDPDPAVVDQHKQDSLAKQKQGKGHWKKELASDSEESVKADREGPTGHTPEDIKKLQERTKKAAEELGKHGTSMHDGM
ncbi:hypothetical protein P8C59_004390 [Phyllachora maydis]|uniref:Mitochondrial carrier protein pet8 protein n=1 Tax=Phyllachora maydis TaxID=1825666 RepID=A0AAD9I266_9PEZI|nr:hypothetical protein P8C59_004390 [Phyllachora maydis]